MLKVLPFIMVIPNFVLHGGTALNLFYFNMSRFSMDIDLRWFGDHCTKDFKEKAINAFQKVSVALREKGYIVAFKEKSLKLKISQKWGPMQITVHVDFTKDRMNGLGKPAIRTLSTKAQKLFNLPPIKIRCLNREELFGNKLFVAGIRQLPKDIFDAFLIKKTLNKMPELTIKTLVFNIVTPSYDNGIIDFFTYNATNHSHEHFNKNFEEMTFIKFTYQNYLMEKEQHQKDLLNILSQKDKEFILSVQKLNPRWGIYNFEENRIVEKSLEKISQKKRENFANYKSETSSLEKILFPNGTI